MKKIVIALALLALLLTGCDFGKKQPDEGKEEETAEQAFSYETYYVVNCDTTISMYAAADINSSELCVIPLGASVSYVKTAANGFCNIIYQGISGYALAANLATTPPVIQQKEYVTYYVVNCEKDISMRESPSTTAAAICKLPLGTAVSCIGSADNGFYKISYLGKTGYALASYLSKEPPAPRQEQEIIYVAPAQPEVSYYHPNGVYATCYVVNCKKSITLRKSSSTQSEEVCQIPLGSAVSYIGAASNGFYKVIYNGKTGYALASYLSFSRPSGSDFGGTYLQVVNCKKSITLRTAPKTNSGEYCQIPLGSYVEFLSVSDNGFFLVAYNGLVGYALASYLS